MESSSSRRSLLHTQTSTTSPQRFLSKRIEPAIRGKSCTICLNHIDHRRAAVITTCLHAYCVDCIRRWSDLKRNCPLCNAVFDAWFSQINLSSRTFLKHKLPEISEDIRKLNVEALRSRRRVLVAERRRSREEFDCVNGRTRPLPRQRRFGRSGSESSNSVAERVLQWRASIYEQHLRAVPCFSQSCLERNTAGNNGVKDRILKRIEPWIHRELKAILGDPDPSIIVHVASSLFISGLEEKHEVPSKQFVLEDNFIEPLRPFLHERTNMFWHELRYIICIICFGMNSGVLQKVHSTLRHTTL
ncbi:E3 ubiquitin-protein ligase Topors isoform X2 [Camellia sinensis]|uniref:E3 ubiquitin-protein ligase Topors isoform X2 n=1 Tax=Camellia sinensis TaxID=4442 RepID=UPI001035C9E8|nr:E3 ubiquitin-protein ligase Topors isoform X2 [Camellia sinensis]